MESGSSMADAGNAERFRISANAKKEAQKIFGFHWDISPAFRNKSITPAEKCQIQQHKLM